MTNSGCLPVYASAVEGDFVAHSSVLDTSVDNRIEERAPPMSTHRDLLNQATVADVVAGASVQVTLAGERSPERDAGPNSLAAVTRGPLMECHEPRGPMKDVEGKVAFITGGDSGIGLGITRAFVEAGMKVVIGYRTEKHLEEAMKSLGSASDRAHAINVDVTDRPGLERAAEETVRVFGKIHVLVNNAGVVADGPLSSATYGDWDWVMGVNLTGVFNGLHSFLSRIQAHGDGGHIVTTSSINGLFVADGLAVYSASKAAVVSLMESLRGELSSINIGVSVYCPGFVRTEIASSARNRPGEPNGSSTSPSSVDLEREIAIKRAMNLSMDPFEAGQFVLCGIRNNDLYILSHPEYEQGICDRYEALIASIPRGLPLQESRAAVEQLRNNTYIAERERKRVGRAQ